MEKTARKISSKAIIGIIFSLVLIGGAIAYYISSQDEEGVLSWMDYNWVYRRSLTVANTQGTTLTDEEVLVELDTASLISAGKLQNDCDDLRFLDSDDSTSLTYWVEGGCNTSATQVWIEIPSLPTEGKTIYVYYGNESASNTEISWEGSFITLSTVSCSAGWSRNSNFDDNYVMGAEAYGNSGGSTTHNHTISETISGSTGSAALGTGGSATDPASSTNHTHTLSLTTSTDDSTPPYLSMIFCESTSLDIFENEVLLYDSDSEPTGYTDFTALNDKLPQGSDTYGNTGGSSTHSHTTNATVTGTSSTTTGSVQGDGHLVANRYHAHSVGASTTSSESNLPPYYTVNYIEAGSSAKSESSIITMTTATPPLGWDIFTDLVDKFPMGSDTVGGTGGSATHTHTGTVSLGAVGTSYEREGDGFSYAAITHSHGGSKAYTTNEESLLPPYYTAVFVQRKESESTTVNDEETSNHQPEIPSSPLCEGSTNPVGIADTTPEFSAIFNDSDTEDTGNYYQIVVNTQSDFEGTSMWDSTKTEFGTPIVNGERSTDISYNGTTLERGIIYYWRIKFWDNQENQNESDWSETQTFSLNSLPLTPTNLLTDSSSNPIKVTSSTPVFSAIFKDPDNNDTGEYYEIEVNTTEAFDGTSMWDTGQTGTSSIINYTRSSDYTYAGTSLEAGTTYYWRIRFWDNNSLQGEWSQTSYFIMQGPPNKPTDIMMNRDDIENPTFSAYYSDPNSDSSSAYEIEINSTSSFDGDSIWDTGKTSSTIINQTRSPEYSGYTPLYSENVYYWRIRFWDSDDIVSEWSDTGYFTDTTSYMEIEGTSFEGIKID